MIDLIDDKTGMDILADADEAASCLIPLHGLRAYKDRLSIGDLRIARLGSRTWRLLEKNRTTDLYGDIYPFDNRWFSVVTSRDIGPTTEDAEELYRIAESKTQHFILAARLVAGGMISDPEWSVFYHRSDAMNMRPAEDNRFRLLGTTFGEDLQLPARETTWQGRTVLMPPRVIPSIGPDYWLDEETERDVVYAHQLLSGLDDPGPALSVAVENFSLGNAFIIEVRQRLMSLFAAMEILYHGDYAAGCTAGTRFCAIANGYEREVEDAVSTIDEDWRRVRNNVMHSNVTFDEDSVTLLQSIVRWALWPALKLVSHTPQGERETALPRFKSLLDAAYTGAAGAHEQLRSLCSFS